MVTSHKLIMPEYSLKGKTFESLNVAVEICEITIEREQ
jgi:hypothetical protein